MKLARTLLIILTILLLFQLFQGNFKELFIIPDKTFPRPIVELEIRCQNGFSITIREDGIVKGCEADEELRLLVRLINNSSEPSIRDYDIASGVLLILHGARFTGYKLNDFDNIVGVTEKAELISPINSSIIEIFSKYIAGGQVKEAFFNISVPKNVTIMEILFRGWIIDEDDKVLEPFSYTEENYYARYPTENHIDNPPDSRWSGKEFNRYKTYKVVIFLD